MGEYCSARIWCAEADRGAAEGIAEECASIESEWAASDDVPGTGEFGAEQCEDYAWDVRDALKKAGIPYVLMHGATYDADSSACAFDGEEEVIAPINSNFVVVAEVLLSGEPCPDSLANAKAFFAHRLKALAAMQARNAAATSPK